MGDMITNVLFIKDTFICSGSYAYLRSGVNILAIHVVQTHR